MRLVMVMVLAALVASPLSVSAQAGEDGTEPTVEEPIPEQPAPPSEPAPEEPALQLKLDDAGVGVVPSPPRTFNGYTLEELELRKRRAAFGLIAPAAVTIAGVALLAVGTSGDWETDAQRRSFSSGIALTTAGGVGMIVGLSLLGARARAHRLAERGKYVGPSPTRTAEEYTLEELELRVKRARTGLIVSSVIVGVGVALWVGGAVNDARNPPPDAFFFEIPNGLIVAGLTLTMAGSTGMLVSGAMLGVRKRKQRKLKQVHYGTPRRAQWDLARSRLVF